METESLASRTSSSGQAVNQLNRLTSLEEEPLNLDKDLPPAPNDAVRGHTLPQLIRSRPSPSAEAVVSARIDTVPFDGPLATDSRLSGPVNIDEDGTFDITHQLVPTQLTDI